MNCHDCVSQGLREEERGKEVPVKSGFRICNELTSSNGGELYVSLRFLQSMQEKLSLNDFSRFIDSLLGVKK